MCLNECKCTTDDEEDAIMLAEEGEGVEEDADEDDSEPTTRCE